VQAARELQLRAWKADHPLVDDEVKLEEQPAMIRNKLFKRLLAELGKRRARWIRDIERAEEDRRIARLQRRQGAALTALRAAQLLPNAGEANAAMRARTTASCLSNRSSFDSSTSSGWPRARAAGMVTSTDGMQVSPPRAQRNSRSGCRPQVRPRAWPSGSSGKLLRPDSGLTRPREARSQGA
jgi:hypothetical protein